MALSIGVDSFVSVAGADTYWTDHAGGTNWASATATQKEQALREASQYIDKSYTWRGHHPGDEAQLLGWPRYNVIDREGRYRDSGVVPQEVKDATSWLAEQVLDGALLPVIGAGGQPRRVKAGSVEVEYSGNAPSQKSFPYVDLLVSDLIRGGKHSTIMLKG